MQRPIRSTRSKASPGLIDRPTSRRPTTVVAKEKATKKQAAASKADEQHRHAAQVAEIEKEIKQAQAEAQPVGQRGGGKVVKKHWGQGVTYLVGKWWVCTEFVLKLPNCYPPGKC